MSVSIDERFGNALRLLREAAGKTQEDFSVGRSYLSELERGLKTPTLDTIVRLASELGTSPARIVAIATSNEPPGTKQADNPQGSTTLQALNGAFALASAQPVVSNVIADETPISAVEDAALATGVEIPKLLAAAALVAFRQTDMKRARQRRRDLRFIIADKRPVAELRFATGDEGDWSFSPVDAHSALVQTNVTLELADDVLGMNGIPFFELIGTRNLGSFVGAVFAYSLQRELPDRLRVNGHQDGYPDLCALTEKGRKYIEQLEATGMQTAKKSWAFYPEGGIEVKTTCGSVPAPSKKRPKPQIGDQRTGQLTGADWKAHHRETNRLLGLFWDFIDGVPTVLALFYRNDLTQDDWRKVTVPKPETVENVEEGMDENVVVEVALKAPRKVGTKKRKGRTTSVSIMTSAAVKKMGKSWIVLPRDVDLLVGLCKRSVFDLGSSDIASQTADSSSTVRNVLQTLDQARDREASKRTMPKAPKPRKSVKKRHR